MDHMLSALRTRKTVTVTQPAVNTDWSVSVPTGSAWLIKTICAVLVQGAAQTPQPVLLLSDAAGNVFAEGVGSTSAQSASTTCSYSWAADMVQSGLVGTLADVHAQSPLPCGEELYMLEGWSVSTHTIGKGANTQWTNIVLYVVENQIAMS